MDKLNEVLKQQHWAIRSHCDILMKFCVNGVDTKGGEIEQFWEDKTKFALHLNNFKKILIPHLALEDAELYPLLIKAKDKKIREASDKYSDEMELISKRTLSFFETYTHLKIDHFLHNELFKLDLNTVITIIRKRIDLEEIELYPLYILSKKS